MPTLRNIYRDHSGTLEPDARPCRRAWCVVAQPHYSTPNVCCYCAGERPRHSAACVHNTNPLGRRPM